MRAPPQELVSRLQRAQVIARVGEMRRHLVLHRAVEEPAPAVGRSLHQPQIIGREGHHRDAAEEVVRIAHGLAVEPGSASSVPDRHLDLPFARVDCEAGADERLGSSEPHQLGELLRTERTQRADEIAGLQEIRLALAVRAEEHGRGGSERYPVVREVAEVARSDFPQDQRPTPSRRDRSALLRQRCGTGISPDNARPSSAWRPL
jgi:hypothetical protein